jgi:dsDNA-specific endonuclease/ATPase MutS2
MAQDRAENACVDFDEQTLEPTYHLRIGEPGTSNAIQIAQRLGMPQRLVNACERNMAGKAGALNDAIASTRHAKREAETARAEAEQARLEADRTERAAKNAHAALEQSRADFDQWLRRVVHLRAGDPVRVRNFDRDGRVVRMRLDQQRAEVEIGSFAVEVSLGDLLPPETTAPPPPAVKPKPPSAPMAPKPKRQAAKPPSPVQSRDQRPAGDRGPAALSEAQVEKLGPDDRVYVRRFHREGTVVRLDRVRKIATVSVGVLEVEVPFSGLANQSGARPRPPRQSDKPQSVE